MKLTKSDWRQARRGKRVTVSINDKYAKLALENGIKFTAFEVRVRRGMDPLEAATKPLHKKRKVKGDEPVKVAAERHGVHWQSVYNWRKNHKDISASMTADEMAQRVAENARKGRGRHKAAGRAGASP